MNENISGAPNWIPITFGTPEEKKEHTPDISSKNSKTDPFLKSRILIVEDEALVGENVREFLEIVGYSVVDVVYSGEEALRIISRQPIDLILMDIRLAGKMDGIEAALMIHKTIREIPIVFLTAYAEELYPKIYSISPLLYRFIAKPYDGDMLKKAVKDLLESRKA